MDTKCCKECGWQECENPNCSCHKDIDKEIEAIYSKDNQGGFHLTTHSPTDTVENWEEAMIVKFVKNGWAEQSAHEAIKEISLDVRRLLLTEKQKWVSQVEKLKLPRYCTADTFGYHDKNCENCEYNHAIDDCISLLKETQLK